MLISLSGLTLALTFPSNVHEPALPRLVPILGVPFAVLYLTSQAILVALLRSATALRWLIGFMIVGAFLGWIGVWANLLYWGQVGGELLVTPARHIWCSTACISGLALGVGLVRGNLP